MKNFLYIFSSIFVTQSAYANQPVDWQLGFQKAASESMRDIVAFHDNLLLPIIIAIIKRKKLRSILFFILQIAIFKL